MFTGTVNFDYSKIRKMRIFFTKSAAHFQKLMFTGTMNFDLRKLEKCVFFKKSRRPFSKVNVYRHCEF